MVHSSKHLLDAPATHQLTNHPQGQLLVFVAIVRLEMVYELLVLRSLRFAGQLLAPSFVIVVREPGKLCGVQITERPVRFSEVLN